MASKYWIKLYHEILQDPKMGRLPDNVWRRAIELFLLAGELDEDGKLPETEEIAWLLRRPIIETFEAELAHLEKVGILTRLPDGWLVTKFADRQAASTDADRMKEYRKRKREGQFSGPESEKTPVEEQKELAGEEKVPPESEKGPDSEQKPGVPLHSDNGHVTQPVTSPVTKRNTDTDIESDSDQELINDEEESHVHVREEKVAAIMELYQNNINTFVSPIMAQEMLSDEFIDLPLNWWEEAVKIAAGNNVRKWVYVRGILSRSIQLGLSPEAAGPPESGRKLAREPIFPLSIPSEIPEPEWTELTPEEQVLALFKDRVSVRIPAQTWKEHIAPMQLAGCPNGRIQIKVNRFTKELIDNRFSKVLDPIAQELSPGGFEYVVI